MESTRSMTYLDRIWQPLDQLLGLIFLFTTMPVVLLGIFAYRTLNWEGDNSDARVFLMALIATIGVHAAVFAAATFAAFSNGPRYRLWMALGVLAVLLYIFGFVWPYLDRVWAGVSEDGFGSIGTHLSEQARLLFTGGLLVTELGPFISGSLVLLAIRGAIAGWRWRSAPPPEPELVSSASARDAAAGR